MDHLDRTEKALPQDIKQQKGKEEDLHDEETTNGVF
jgi:hypothetical protein